MRRATRDAGGNRGHGGKWIRPEKRRRIYERDGWRCVWCGVRVELVGRFQSHVPVFRVACLDHVLPREHGGSNHESNLVTSCLSCNSARGAMRAIDYVYDRWLEHERPGVLWRVITAMGTELPPRPKRARIT